MTRCNQSSGDRSAARKTASERQRAAAQRLRLSVLCAYTAEHRTADTVKVRRGATGGEEQRRAATRTVGTGATMVDGQRHWNDAGAAPSVCAALCLSVCAVCAC